jgi:hypothetical protein
MNSFYSGISWYNQLFFPLFYEEIMYASGTGNKHVQIIEVIEKDNNNNKDVITS